MVEYVAHRNSKELKQRQRRRQQEWEKKRSRFVPPWLLVTDKFCRTV